MRQCWLRRAALVGAGYLVTTGWVGCSCQPAPTSSHGIKTPLGPVPASASAVTASGPGSAGAGGRAAGGAEEPVPVLADPRLGQVAQALETGSPRAGALALDQVMTKSVLGSVELLRWRFLLARLWERAGEPSAAAAAYRLTVADDWPLREYARIGLARALATEGDLVASRAELGRVRAEPPLGGELSTLRAELALREHDLDRAIEVLRLELGAPEDSSDRAALSLRLAEALAERGRKRSASGVSAGVVADQEQALDLVRRVRFERPGEPLALRAEQVEKRLLASLTAAERARLGVLSAEQQLHRLRGLVGARLDDAAEQAAEALVAGLPRAQRWNELGCEASMLGAKAVALKRKPARALEWLTEPIRRCRGDEWRSKALYLAGTYAAQDGRHMQAVRYFEQLERELPQSSLADDARLKAALSYFELGVEAEFTRLLSRLPEDFPGGDMVLEGCFRLALRRIEKGDWSGAASVLDRAMVLAQGREYARGTEFSGRERYFRARAWIETGEAKRGYDELAKIALELPLSYYMLHAYSRLREVDGQRARRVREEAARRALELPFTIAPQPEFEQPGFLRAKELLWVGEVELAVREIQHLGLTEAGVAPEILWGVVLLYARAGAAKLSHALARGLLTDWLRRWPEGDWIRAWQLAFPRPFEPLVKREAHKNQLSPALIYAIMREESGFDPDAVSPADAYGLMQLIVPTAKVHARPLGLPFDARALKNPALNVTLGCRVLAKLGDKFRDNPLLAIPGYNAGPGRPQRWLRERPNLDFDVWVELIPFLETRRYTKRVLASRAAYTYLYESPAADEALLLPKKLVTE